ncbi:hypothetical protein NIES4101_74010 [Calothrix sp. NIES-4101]|nr:hypothetical protein NIES4101_74010 [Calothrix sp. NIES-4101]
MSNSVSRSPNRGEDPCPICGSWHEAQAMWIHEHSKIVRCNSCLYPKYQVIESESPNFLGDAFSLDGEKMYLLRGKKCPIGLHVLTHIVRGIAEYINVRIPKHLKRKQLWNRDECELVWFLVSIAGGVQEVR